LNTLLKRVQAKPNRYLGWQARLADCNYCSFYIISY